MPDPQQEPMDVAGFLAWSLSRPEGEAWELVGGTPLRMQAEKNRHNLLKTEVAVELRNAIRRGGDCRYFGDGVTVVIDEHHGYRPDGAVQCGGPVDLDGLTVESPIIVVEVLSPATAYRDTGEKLAAYLGLPSVRHYLVFDPARLALTHHERQATEGPILTSVLRGGALELPPTGLVLDVDACFAVLAEDG